MKFLPVGLRYLIDGKMGKTLNNAFLLI